MASQEQNKRSPEGTIVEPSPGMAEVASARAAGALSLDAREKVERYIEEEEGAFNRLGGRIGVAIMAAAVCVSLFHLYAAYEIVPAHVLRPSHVGMVLVLCFLLFPMAHRFRDRIRVWDYMLAASSAATVIYIMSKGAEFVSRVSMPTK